MKTVYEALNDLALSLPKESITKVVLSKEAYDSFQATFKVPLYPTPEVNALVTENGQIHISTEN